MSEQLVINAPLEKYSNTQKITLGQGHYGTVRLATPIKEDGKIYAVKAVSREKVKNDLQALYRELKLLRDLDHPNIIKLHETYHNSEFFHFVMEYCSGGNLTQYVVKHVNLREEEIAKIMSKAFSAVKYLNDRGIVHRDIKPDNFLFSTNDSDAEIKLIDFGLARSKYADGKLRTKVGTPIYIAPEVLQGKYDEKCDYWSLGVMLYFFLTRNLPFNGDNVAEITKNVLKKKLSFEGKQWEGISHSAIDLCKKLLERNPANRMTVSEALEHPWIKQVDKKSKIDRATTKAILDNLRAFTRDKRFKIEILNVLLLYLNEKELKQLHDAFIYFDKDQSGGISLTDLKSVMKENDIQISDEELEQIIMQADIDQTHLIRYSEFKLAALDPIHYLSKEKLWAAFKHFDIDGTNYITSSNVREALARSGRRIPLEELNEMVKEADLTKDGKIDFEDFCSIVKVNGLKIDTQKDIDVFDMTKAATLRNSYGSPKASIPYLH